MNYPWLEGLPSFDQPQKFEGYDPEDQRRRIVLQRMAQRDEVMSYYEARNIPFNELIAMAVEKEKRTPLDASMFKVRYERGETADETSVNINSRVYSLHDDRMFTVVKWIVRGVSNRGFLVNLHDDIRKQNVVFPTSFIFSSEKVAQFMHKELRALSLTPDVRT
jgi:hypothetical protein